MSIPDRTDGAAPADTAGGEGGQAAAPGILESLHRAAGARLTAPEAGSRLLTYGDVPAEYAAGKGATLLFDACDRGAVRVRGSEAESFLHRITSNTVRGLEPGSGCRNLLLTAKGKVRHEFDLARGAEGFELSTPAGEAPGLVQDLDMFLFTEDVQIEDVSAEHAPLECCGPLAAETIQTVLGEAAPLEDHRTGHFPFEGTRVAVTRLEVAGWPGYRIDAGPAAAPALWRALVAAGARPGGRVVRDILRVEACSAEWGQDTGPEVYPQEARLESAFSLDKGCYIGQEVVAKIDTYGGLNKCLFALRVDHDDPVPAGTRLMRADDGDEWRDLGVVTSWAYSFVHDTGAVLGYVKRKHQEVGTVFRLGDGPGTATIV